MNAVTTAESAAIVGGAGAQIAEYNTTEQALADLRRRYGGVVFDVKSNKGLGEAKEGRAELRELRISLEAKRVELKAPLLERGRIIDGEAKRLTAEIVSLEDPIDAIIKKEEARREEVKREKERIEKARIAALRARVDELRGVPMSVVGKSAAVIQSIIAQTTAIVIDEAEFQELAGEANLVREFVLSKLEEAHAAQLAAEAEQARLKAEREALERQRVEQERQRAEQEARDRAEREAQAAALRAERERQEVELRAQREEAARQEAERAAQVAIERAELERQRAEVEAARRALEATNNPPAAEIPVEPAVAPVAPAAPVVATPASAPVVVNAAPAVDARLVAAKAELAKFRENYAGVAGLEGVLKAIADVL